MSAFRKLALLTLLLMLAATPVLAQGNNETVRIAFGGFSFSLDPALAVNVNIVRQAADAEMSFPPQPAHTRVYLYDGPDAPFSFADGAGALFLYRVADLSFEEEHQKRAEALQTLLAERPDLVALAAADVRPGAGTVPGG